jgi:hypothetical protein
MEFPEEKGLTEKMMKNLELFGQANEVSLTRMLVNYKFCTCFVASSSSSYSCLDFVVAAKILPVVKNQHLLLCTLLIGNALAMEVWSSFVHISS